MVGEIFAGLNAFKTALDLARGLKDIDDAVRRNAVVIELQEQILTAQSAQQELIDRERKLQAELAELKAWGAEKQNYELKSIEGRTFVYVLKPGARPSEPGHWLCPTCYNNDRKSFMQFTRLEVRDNIYKCPQCETTIRTAWNITPAAMQSQPAKSPGAPCPKCGELEFRIERSERNPTFGVVGGVRRHMKCDKCGFTEDRLDQPK